MSTEPSSITELYDRYFDLALGSEDYQKKGIEVLFDYHTKKQFLAALAYREFREKNRLEMCKADFSEFLKSYGKRFGWQATKLKEFVREIERAGIVSSGDQTQFKHRSFLEYFAAFHVFDNRGEIQSLNELIIETYFNDTWTNISFFYIGLRRVISQELLEGLHAYKSEGMRSDLDKLLSSRLLQAGWNSPTEQHIYGIRQAIGYAPKVKRLFHDSVVSLDSKVPEIFSDFLVLVLADLSFSSRFLSCHMDGIFRELYSASVNIAFFLGINQV